MKILLFNSIPASFLGLGLISTMGFLISLFMEISSLEKFFLITSTVCFVSTMAFNNMDESGKPK